MAASGQATRKTARRGFRPAANGRNKNVVLQRSNQQCCLTHYEKEICHPDDSDRNGNSIGLFR